MSWLSTKNADHVDYSGCTIFRSMLMFEKFYSNECENENTSFDLVVIACPSYSYFRESLKIISKFTTNNTVVLVDGAIGANYESLVFEIIPNVISLCFTCDAHIKFVGDNEYYILSDVSKIVMNIGFSGIPNDSKLKHLKARVNKYLSKDSKDKFFQLLDHLSSVDVSIQRLVDDEGFSMCTYVWYNTILSITSDALAIALDDYFSLESEIETLALYKSTFCELLFIATACGAHDLNQFCLNDEKTIEESILKITMKRPRFIDGLVTTPPFIYFPVMIYCYMNNLESHALISIYHVLIISDSLGINNSSLTFLYGLLVSKLVANRRRIKQKESLPQFPTNQRPHISKLKRLPIEVFKSNSSDGNANDGNANNSTTVNLNHLDDTGEKEKREFNGLIQHEILYQSLLQYNLKRDITTDLPAEAIEMFDNEVVRKTFDLGDRTPKPNVLQNVNSVFQPMSSFLGLLNKNFKRDLTESKRKIIRPPSSAKPSEFEYLKFKEMHQRILGAAKADSVTNRYIFRKERQP
ncbi:hypothetical protein WICMUC_002204 [Wickerhamomyces mucosus]|uniref:Uncharacterized protein n=1 Tax=Wickerhamomyces mucosus TaxID=1378264 RepID=A0A9P8PRC4_9ASCO|nr:hypothetical protein WICMUC_002204 [Wickerhamomyces mucosus]